MAITYKKPLKTIVITTIKGTEVTVADTAEEAKASMALAEFEDYKTMHCDGTLIPFHAVDNVKVTAAQSEDITKADPFCE